ncbi:MAG: PIG-L family deacetylase [Bacteroidia bacterium]|nr:PIG-L family deacetylase [Bacteroidia bacterium]
MSLKSFLIATLILFFTSITHAQQSPRSASDILLSLQKLNTLGSVLYIAAHPDDENTRLLSYYSNEKKFRTTYLSLTRGDGGQNLIGTEQGDLLGVIRTQELLAARKIDGAEQCFSRAIDFGYSKNPEETFKIWNKDSMLSDVVFAIRKYQPDIIILRFPTTGEGGHGHHTASAIVGMDAFVAAANPKMFPDQLSLVQTWQSKRIFWNMFRPKEEDIKGKTDIATVDIGTYNSLIGKSYGEMASESRSMHKSQGFGVARSRGTQNDYLKQLSGEPFIENELSGITTTWDRVENSNEIKNAIEKLISDFKSQDPGSTIPGLLAVRNLIRKNIKDVYWRELKIREAEELILSCGGFFLEATSSNFSVVSGDSLSATISVVHRANVPVTLLDLNSSGYMPDSAMLKVLSKNVIANIPRKLYVNENQKFSNPYWLDEHGLPGLFSTTNPTLNGIPETSQPIKFNFLVKIADDTLLITRPLVYKWVDPVKGELYRPLEILPAVNVNPDNNVFLFTDGKSRSAGFTIKANKANTKGDVYLEVPKGWKFSPEKISFQFKEKNEEKKISFSITAPNEIAEGTLKAIADLNGKKFSKSITRVDYDHIPVQTLVQDASATLVNMDLNTVPLKVAYIEGAGDNIPACLRQIGYTVTILDDEMLSQGNLSAFDVIITGIRLYNTNDRMNVYQPRLMEFVKAGGTLLVQYNTNNFISNLKAEIGPAPFKITRERVTDETAEVRILKQDHPLLNQPNKIATQDFKGWIQERGIYFAGDYGSNYESLFSMNDPGQEPNEGSLIYSKHGEGHFIYTGLAFFRELPAGVPGAYRLFVNLMAAGRPQHD